MERLIQTSLPFERKPSVATYTLHEGNHITPLKWGNPGNFGQMYRCHGDVIVEVSNTKGVILNHQFSLRAEIIFPPEVIKEFGRIGYISPRGGKGNSFR